MRTFEGNGRIRFIVVIIRDGGKRGDHPGTDDDPTVVRPSRPVAPLRNPGVNPLSCRPIFNPLTGSDLGGQGEVTSQAMMTQLPSDFEVIQGPAQHPRNLTRMALPLTGTRHTCIFENWDNFRSDISLFASPPSEEPSFQTLRNKISCNIFLRMISSN